MLLYQKLSIPTSRSKPQDTGTFSHNAYFTKDDKSSVSLPLDRNRKILELKLLTIFGMLLVAFNFLEWFSLHVFFPMLCLA